MWNTTKKFKTQKDAENFINENKHQYKCDLLFVHNGYKVEYKKIILMKC